MLSGMIWRIHRPSAACVRPVFFLLGPHSVFDHRLVKPPHLHCAGT